MYVVHLLAFFFSYLVSAFLVKIGAEKIHKDTKYVLFLDDDVRLHPGTVGALTAEMEKNPEVATLTIYFLN